MTIMEIAMLKKKRKKRRKNEYIYRIYNTSKIIL